MYCTVLYTILYIIFYKEIKVIYLFSQEHHPYYLLYNVLNTTIHTVLNTLLCNVLYSILFKNIKVPHGTILFIEELFSSCLYAVLNTLQFNVLNTEL